jgi:glycerol-3-phosphate O-acyltransferase
MAESVTLPLWAVVLLGLGAAWALVEEIFLHKVRTRLSLRLPAFKLIRKRRIIDRLLSDPVILSAVDEAARAEKVPAGEALRRAEAYAREIVPSFHAFAYYLLGGFLGAWFVRSLFRVRVGYADEAALAAVPPDSSIVFLLNHRSNLDYILLGYLTLGRAPISFAVGEWARVWPIKPLVTALGAYFVRRGSPDPLYRRVLARYVQMTAEGGLIQAVFPEGRLSRDGRMGAPKLGLLDYLLRGFDPNGNRDLVFIPAGVNLDRVFEDRTLLLGDSRGAKGGAGRAFRKTTAFVFRNFRLMIRGGWRRFGYAMINFGRPVSMREYTRAERFDFRGLDGPARASAVERLARDLMGRVGACIPVLPVSLMASVFVPAGESWLTREAVIARALELMRSLEARGSFVYRPFRGAEYAAEFGLDMLVLRHLVEKDGERFRLVPSERPLATYYANAVAHLLPEAAPSLT